MAFACSGTSSASVGSKSTWTAALETVGQLLEVALAGIDLADLIELSLHATFSRKLFLTPRK